MLRCSRIPLLSRIEGQDSGKGQGEAPAFGELAAIHSPASSQPRQKQKVSNSFEQCVSQNNANLH